MSIHTDFALVLGAHLERRVVVTDKLYYFDEHLKPWKIACLKPLPALDLGHQCDHLAPR